MERNTKYVDAHKAKIYKDLYRPSTNLSRFIKTLWGIVVSGDSPISHQRPYNAKKIR